MSITRHLSLDSPTAPVDLSRGSVFFIGTATVIIRYAGFTILTDPNFLHKGQHVRLGYGLRSRRLTQPALDIEALPDLDLVVLSHFHEDHFDRVAEERLTRTLPIVTTPHAADKLARVGFNAAEALTTWQTLSCSKADTRLRITAMPGRHGPRLVSALLPPVMGSMLEFETSAGDRLLRLYITGDTLMFDKIHEIRARYADLDLALLHLGGTRVLGILVTMDGRQGVEMMRAVNPHLSIPIHYDDYTVFKSPRSDFEREVNAARMEPRVQYLHHGETYTFNVPERRRQRRSA
jgi:L-ascorbate metabolism protein UlaG (beta-lactamase superfamily)